MSGRAKMVVIVMLAFILLSFVSFLLLAKYYPPLNRKLFGGYVPISFNDIQFWVEKVPVKNYYKVYARYLKSPETEMPDFGHGIFFDIENDGGGLDIVFNPEDNRIYGGGAEEIERENGNYIA